MVGIFQGGFLADLSIRKLPLKIGYFEVFHHIALQLAWNIQMSDNKFAKRLWTRKLSVSVPES